MARKKYDKERIQKLIEQYERKKQYVKEYQKKKYRKKTILIDKSELQAKTEDIIRKTQADREKAELIAEYMLICKKLKDKLKQQSAFEIYQKLVRNDIG